MPVFLTNFLLIALFVRRKRICRTAWTEAGFTRRSATLSWAVAWLMQNGSLGDPPIDVPITVDDLFPTGVDHVTRVDIGQLHALIGNWLSFWSERAPTTSLQDAMLSLTLRLIAAKRGWIAEKADPFPLRECLAGITDDDFENAFRAGHLAAGISISEDQERFF